MINLSLHLGDLIKDFHMKGFTLNDLGNVHVQPKYIRHLYVVHD